jgi:hypothetical protein
VQTLDLMVKNPPLTSEGKVKVPRSTVRRALALAGAVAFSDSAIRALHPGGPPAETVAAEVG